MLDDQVAVRIRHHLRPGIDQNRSVHLFNDCWPLQTGLQGQMVSPIDRGLMPALAPTFRVDAGSAFPSALADQSAATDPAGLSPITDTFRFTRLAWIVGRSTRNRA